MDAIKKLSDYVSGINDIYTKCSNEKLWYRGHSSTKYILSPSIFREPYKEKIKSYEGIFKNDFKARAIPYLDRIIEEELDWMFLMQHYKIPTRLLDWSEDAFVALLFALKDHDETLGVNAVIYIMDPYELNKRVYESVRITGEYTKLIIPNLINKSNNNDLERLYSLYGNEPIMEIKFPLAILPPKNNTRIIAQKGVFTIFPLVESITPIDELDGNEQFLWKIEIDNEAAKDILKELKSLGINETSLFPELDLITMEIISQYKGKL